MHWPQDTTIEKTFIIKDTFFEAKNVFGLFFLDFSPIVGHGLSGITQGKRSGSPGWKELVGETERWDDVDAGIDWSAWCLSRPGSESLKQYCCPRGYGSLAFCHVFGAFYWKITCV